MLTVSHQGSKLSPGQRQQLAFRNQVKSTFMNAHLIETVQAAEQAAAAIRDKDESRFRYDHYETQHLLGQLHKISAPSFAEWMGF